MSIKLSKKKPRPHKLHKHLLDLNARESLWSPADTIIMGVSGGGDSMCLLHAMYTLADKEGLAIIVAHINYGMRSADADRDERHVRRTAERYGFSCEVKRLTPARHRTENDMRLVRHEFFCMLKEEYDAQSVMLAHTMDDHAETLLMHLVRGAGINGLGNMSYRDGVIVRPLLGTTGSQTRSYCREVGVRYYNDYTNVDARYMRNRMRHKTLPHLAHLYNPQIVRTLSETAHRLHDAAQAQSSYLQNLFPWHQEKDKITFDFSDYQRCSPEQRRNILRELCLYLQPSGDQVTYRQVRDADHMLMSQKNKSSKIPVGSLIVGCKNATVEITLSQSYDLS